MADHTIFDVTFYLDVPADVTLDFSASQGYNGFSGSEPWGVRINVDGSDNNARGGAGAVSDVISCMGACGQLAAGNHNVKVIWYGSSRITLSGQVLRALITKR